MYLYIDRNFIQPLKYRDEKEFSKKMDIFSGNVPIILISYVGNLKKTATYKNAINSSMGKIIASSVVERFESHGTDDEQQK